MPDLVLVCQKLEPSDWLTLRGTRLAALADSPAAFAPREDERYWSPARWQHTLQTATWVIARSGDDDVIGLAMSEPDQGNPRHRSLQAIWVRPSHRRQGVLRALVADLISRAEEDGVEELSLWVLEDNHEARDVYPRLGFELTGVRWPAPRRRSPEGGATASDRERYELQMRLRLGRWNGTGVSGPDR